MQRLTRLNPKISNMMGIGSGNAPQDVTPQDIAASLAGADPIGLGVLLASVCNDKTVQKPLFYKAYGVVAGLASERKWAIPRGKERLRSLTQLAIFELTNAEVCPICKGSSRNPFKPTEKCKACKKVDGVGRPIITDRLRAKALDITPSAWSQTWCSRYNKIIINIQDCVHKAKKSINRLGG